MSNASFRVRLAFEQYSVGQLIQPTGLWRDSLLSRGFIERVEQPVVVVESEPSVERQAPLARHSKRLQRGNGSV